MSDDSHGDLQNAGEFEGETSRVTQAHPSIGAENCSTACRLHWPLRLLSILIIAGGLGLYGLLEFAPEITNVIPDSALDLVGFDSGHHCSSMERAITSSPIVDRELPIEEFSGITACALCEYGVSPLHDARTKGMAIVLEDGRIAVVENAHNLHPDAYRDREKHLRAELIGRVVKSEKNVIWVHPESLELISSELEASDSSPK